MYSDRPLSELREMKKELVFIHTPKCGGTYVFTVLSPLKIKFDSHKQAILDDKYIYFTVIRDPIERFESLLNFRLNEVKSRDDWPNNLSYVYDDKTIKLDEIVSKMTDKEILGFTPYKTLNYYATNVDIIITLDNLPKLLEYFGYTYNVSSFKPVNVSKK